MTTDYATLVRKIGSLFSELRSANGAFDGEHTIEFTGRDGVTCAIKIHIEGSSIEFMSVESGGGLTVNVKAGQK